MNNQKQGVIVIVVILLLLLLFLNLRNEGGGWEGVENNGTEGEDSGGIMAEFLKTNVITTNVFTTNIFTINLSEGETLTVDRFGNPMGSEYDLCEDGAHRGKTIVILSIGGITSLNRVTPALQTKGFSVVSHTTMPNPQELRLELKEACQIWVISSSSRLLNEQHIQVIKEFFERGKGVYIWGDNKPYYADANALGKALLGVEMSGNTPGDQVVNKSLGAGKPGFIAHPVTTGLNNIFEGVTIATIGEAQNIQPIMRGSANNVVTAVYDRDGKRAVIDGGFTRLWPQLWDKTAGTARFVKNAACWLVNPKR